MTRKAKDELIVILDRSGSMAPIKAAMEGGLNTFLNEQRNNKDLPPWLLTVVKFDDRYDLVHDAVDPERVGRINLEPRSSTALLDAIGKTINHVRYVSEREKGKVIVVIVTDGHENASMTWTHGAVRELVRAREAEGWQFVYIGAGIDAYDANQTGIPAMNTMSIGKDAISIGAAYSALSVNTTLYRGGQVTGMSWTDAQRAEAEKK